MKVWHGLAVVAVLAAYALCQWYNAHYPRDEYPVSALDSPIQVAFGFAPGGTGGSDLSGGAAPNGTGGGWGGGWGGISCGGCGVGNAGSGGGGGGGGGGGAPGGGNR